MLPTVLGLAFKLVQEADKSWRRVRCVQQIDDLLAGIAVMDGVPATTNDSHQ